MSRSSVERWGTMVTHTVGKSLYLTNWNSSRSQRLSQSASVIIRLLLALVVLGSFTNVSAIDSRICCLKAARAAYTKDSKLLPWESCAFGASYTEGTYKRGEVPEVTTTVAFCREHCPGVRLSSLEEWLLLLTSWVLPAIALLIICSTGESKEKKDKIVATPARDKPGPLFKLSIVINYTTNMIYRLVPNFIIELAAILGDPASAIRGAFSEIALDVRVVYSLYQQEGFDMMMRALAMVAGQTKFDEGVKIALVNTLIAKGLLVATEASQGDGKISTLRACLSRLEEMPGSLLQQDPDKTVRFKSRKGSPTLEGNDVGRYEAAQAVRRALVCSEENRKTALTESFRTLLKVLCQHPVEVGQPKDKEPMFKPEQYPNLDDPEKGRGSSKVTITALDIRLHQDLQKVLESILEPEMEMGESNSQAIRPVYDHRPQSEIIATEKGMIGVATREVDSEESNGNDPTPFEGSEWAKGLKVGIKMSIKGRVDFMKALVVPVILSLVATAGSFYNAYTELGDNGTAHSLAYGVWYSWIIILAVASNCYIATANPGLPRMALNQQVVLSEITVPLRERAHNTRKWSQWLIDIGCTKVGEAGEQRAEDWNPSNTHGIEEDSQQPISKYRRFFSRFKKLKLLVPARIRKFLGSSSLLERTVTTLDFGLHLLFKQFLGWICVGFTCCCAAIISYTTPTVGLGCRSFNHMLYGVCTLAIAAIAVYREFLNPQNHWTSFVFARAIYMFGICLNVFILLGGTLFHLIGLYRTCLCSVLGAKADFLLQMSVNTALAVGNAKKYWLPIGYVDFGFVWIICCVAVACRGYIHYHIKMFERRLDDEIQDD
ncbi:hypothetical protein BKA65DRAFT_5864 [Rhexocercosporidium sp. MPI-PUGE-AT-0058]|nr:hypothetical protein BKA65DRAFT_5864 [Rhexocercosporidium sp. MPI-PUGE-AT-0058]